MELPEYTIEQLQEQELLEFASMNNEDAIVLGKIAIEVIQEAGLNLCVAIVLAGDTVFQAKLGNTGPDNDSWLRRKAATALHYGRSSMLAKRELGRDGKAPDDLPSDQEELAVAGGAVPIRVNGEVVGTITMSGEPDTVDHAAAVETIRRALTH